MNVTRNPTEHPARTTGETSAVSPLLVSAKDAAAMCGKSVRTWWAWHAAGLIPSPVRVGRSVMWRVEELREWAAGGCPPRNEWNPSQC